MIAPHRMRQTPINGVESLARSYVLFLCWSVSALVTELRIEDLSGYRHRKTAFSTEFSQLRSAATESYSNFGLSVNLSITQRIPWPRAEPELPAQPPGNVAYHAYSATHERTTQAARHHHTGRQAGRPSHRPGRVHGRGQPGNGGPGREHPQRAHRRGNHLRGQRRGPPRRTRSRWHWPSSPTRSAPGIGCRHPAGKRVVRGLIKPGLTQLIMAGGAGDHCVHLNDHVLTRRLEPAELDCF